MSGRTFLGMPHHAVGATSPIEGRPFPQAAPAALANPTLRHNLGHATSVIRAKRAEVVSEVPDWEDLRGPAARSGRNSGPSSRNCSKSWRSRSSPPVDVHWARDAAEANAIVTELVKATGETEGRQGQVDGDRRDRGQRPPRRERHSRHRTDLAELIVQLADDIPSHILVPAIHFSRNEIRDIFRSGMPGVDPAISSNPRELAMAARAYLRERFLQAKGRDQRRQLRRCRAAPSWCWSPKAMAACA